MDEKKRKIKKGWRKKWCKILDNLKCMLNRLIMQMIWNEKIHSLLRAWHNFQSSSSLSLPSLSPPWEVLGPPRVSFQNLWTVVWHRSMLVSVVLNPDSTLSSNEFSRVLYPSSRVPYSVIYVLISPICVPNPSSRVLIPWNWVPNPSSRVLMFWNWVVRYVMSWS